jgi:hypothetical protein
MLIHCCILLDISVWIVLWCTDPRISSWKKYSQQTKVHFVNVPFRPTFTLRERLMWGTWAHQADEEPRHMKRNSQVYMTNLRCDKRLNEALKTLQLWNAYKGGLLWANAITACRGSTWRRFVSKRCYWNYKTRYNVHRKHLISNNI